MEENNEKMQATTANAEQNIEENVKKSEDITPKPILPDEEYASEVAKEDPEELEKARNRLMTLLRIKCKSLGNDMLTLQIQPMVYSMSLSDCNQMYDVLNKKGIFGMMSMVAKHNKETKKAQKNNNP